MTDEPSSEFAPAVGGSPTDGQIQQAMHEIEQARWELQTQALALNYYERKSTRQQAQLKRQRERVTTLQKSKGRYYFARARTVSRRVLGQASPKVVARVRSIQQRKLGAAAHASAPIRPPAGSQTPVSSMALKQDGLAALWPVFGAFGQLRVDLSESELAKARRALTTSKIDSDESLMQRLLQRNNDSTGAVFTDLQAMIELIDAPDPAQHTGGLNGLVLFDARILQLPDRVDTALGRLARAALQAVAGAVPPDGLLLLVSPELPDLGADLSELGRPVHQLTRIADGIALFVQPAPMVVPIAPLVPVLTSAAHKVAIISDFAPAQSPTQLLAKPQARAKYQSSLVALGRYDQYLSLSSAAIDEMPTYGLSPRNATVVWPEFATGDRTDSVASVNPGSAVPSLTDSADVRVVVRGGSGVNMRDAFEACVELQDAWPDLAVTVIDTHNPAPSVVSAAIAAELPFKGFAIASELSDTQRARVLAQASVTLIPLQADGSAPEVIESVLAGTPVVTARTPTNVEFVGDDYYLADVGKTLQWSRALDRAIRQPAAVVRQQRNLLAVHRHGSLETSLANVVRAWCADSDEPAEQPTAMRVNVMRGARPSIGVATPWVPQHTGIADYSKFTIEPLSQFCDVQVYGTWDATRVNPSLRRFDSNTAMVRRHDAFLSVLGNSHFHLPMLRLLHNAGGAVLAHDTRMLELYFGMRGPHATADLMNRSPGHRPVHAREVRSELRNLETLTDTCYWEIAQSADPLIFHSGATAHRVARETGTEPKHIGFIPYRQFAGPMTSADRREAKWALGLNETGLQVVIVGGVDFRTKRDDIIIEALGWLKQWGYDVQLHIVGDVALHGSDLRNVATDAGVSDRVHFAGRVSEQDYQRYLVAGDFGIQLRASSLLSVSGAVTDMAAFGMPGLATDSMAKEMNVPAFIEQVPLAISPLLLAEAVVRWLDGHPDFNAVEEQRRQYLHEHTRENYARALLTAMGVSL